MERRSCLRAVARRHRPAPHRQEAALTEIRALTDQRCRLGESPVWDEAGGRFLWCDIEACAIHAAAPDGGGRRTWTLPDRVCSLGLAEDGRFVVALPKSVALFDPATSRLDRLAVIESDRPDTRLNDGKVGPDGAFWVGSMDERPERRPIGALYRVEGDGRVTCAIEAVRVSNGLAWTPDGRTMFHADTRGPWIERFDFDPATGALSGRTRIATLDEASGRPDGGACDVEGGYWSAGVSAGCLNRFDRDGRLVARLALPVAAPTMPCFGGPGLRTLMVTSIGAVAPERLAARPLTGFPIVLSAPVAGAPVGRFRLGPGRG